jgi:hypothetical protein
MPDQATIAPSQVAASRQIALVEPGSEPGSKVAPVFGYRRDKAQASLTWAFAWHPQRDSNPCRHLERAAIAPHRVLSSACGLVADLLLRTQSR